MLVLAGLALVVGLGATLFQALRGKPAPIPPGQPRRYGLMGGAICPKCGRPFPRHWWGLNAGLGKFDRCDNCGRWSIVRAEPFDKLRAAEAAEIEHAAVAPELSPEEKLRRQLEEIEVPRRSLTLKPLFCLSCAISRPFRWNPVCAGRLLML